MQPVLVELETQGQQVGDGLMETRHEQPPDFRSSHFLIRLRTLWRRVREPMHTAAILAGGHARRLGGVEKAELPVGGLPIIDRAIRVLHAVSGPPFIVADDPRRYTRTGLEVLADRIPDAGALGGLYTAILEAARDRVLVVACDMPFLSVAFLRHLLASGRDADAVVPRTGAGYHPFCAVYSRRCARAIHRRIAAGTLMATALLSEIEVCEVGPDEIARYDPLGAILMNVNTPHDYERATSVARLLDESSVEQPDG